MASQEHKQALLEAMNRTKLPIDTTADQLVLLVTSRDVTLVISFTDKELPPEGANHNRPLYVTLESRKKWIPVVLVDTGSAINVCLVRTAYAIGLRPVDFTPTTQSVRAYDNTSWDVMGTFKSHILINPSEHEAEFHVMDVPATFNLLLGRPWLHQIKAVSSTVHQLVKYPFKCGIATVYGNSTFHPPQGTATPVLEIMHGKEDVFLSGFLLTEAWVVQTIMAEGDGTYVNAQSIYMMNKQRYMPRSGLGMSGRQGGTTAKEMIHNLHAFGLGYKPTIEDWKRKGAELRGRINAKKAGKQYELVHKPIQGTLNGRFVRQGEDFPFLWNSRALV